MAGWQAFWSRPVRLRTDVRRAAPVVRPTPLPETGRSLT